jgi:hypothetical protein
MERSSAAPGYEWLFTESSASVSPCSPPPSRGRVGRGCCFPRRASHRELTPLGDLAILKEEKRYLEMRLDSGMAWAEDPVAA